MPLGSLQQRQLCYGDQNVALSSSQGLGEQVGEEPRKRVHPFCLTLAIKTRNERCHIKNSRTALLLLKILKIHNKVDR